MTAGRAEQRLRRGHRAQLLVVPPGRQPRLQELRVGRLRLHHLRPGARGLVQHVLLPGRARLLAALRLRRRRRDGPGPARRRRPRRSASARETGIDLPGRGRRPDRGPEVEARLLRGHEGLLLRARRGGRRRLPAPVRARVLRRGLRLPRRRRGELRDRPGRHDPHAAAARPRLRRDLQRRHALRAAGRQGGRQRGRHGAEAVRAQAGRPGRRHRRPSLDYVDNGAARRPEGRARWRGSSPTSRSTGCTSAARPAPPRSTASSRRRGSRRTTRTTWS